MSVELPEAQILARQMDEQLRGKRVQSCYLQDYEKLQKIGFVNKNIKDFDKLVNGKIESVTSRGNMMRVRLDNGANLLLAPEYGGGVTYHANRKTVPNKLHLRLDFSDHTVLAVRLTGMGVIHSLKDSELEQSYVYKRDFLSEVPSPINDNEFTFECFTNLLKAQTDMIKSLLVGKEAVVVGLGNSAYQDIIYKARIHPKRNASELDDEEKHRLYNAIRFVVEERIRLGGKDKFIDLYGKRGTYKPLIGSHIGTCPACGTSIEKLSTGGGQTYFCPNCQK